MAAGFEGFGEHAIDFYEGLVADNSKAYWGDHKGVYDDQIRAPMLALLAELEPEFGTGKISARTAMSGSAPIRVPTRHTAAR